MIIDCMQCNIEYRLDEESLREAKKRVQICCGTCGCSLYVLILPADHRLHAVFLRKDEETQQLNSQFAEYSSI